jgi:quinol monooxygenase YgiN
MLGKLTALQGKGDELAEILLEAAGVLGADDACLLYVVNESADDPDTVWVAEAWRSQEAHRASLERDDVRALISRAGPLLAGSPEPIGVRPIGGKGVEGAE